VKIYSIGIHRIGLKCDNQTTLVRTHKDDPNKIMENCVKHEKKRIFFRGEIHKKVISWGEVDEKLEINSS